MSAIAATLTSVRSTLADRRAVRRERQRLEQELAGYDTPAGRQELYAILGRHTDEEVASIAPILDRCLTLN